MVPSIRIALSRSTPISAFSPSCVGSGDRAILSPLNFLEDLRSFTAFSKLIQVSGSSQEAGLTSVSPVALLTCQDKGSLPGLDLPASGCGFHTAHCLRALSSLGIFSGITAR